MFVSLQIAFPENASSPSGSPLYFAVATPTGVSKKVSGCRAVEQHFTKLMLTNLGSNTFNRDEGTSLSEISKQTVSQDNMLSIRNDIALSILTVQNQILSSQEDIVLDLSEVLVSAEVQSIDYSEGTGWYIVVALTMADGNATQVLLGA